MNTKPATIQTRIHFYSRAVPDYELIEQKLMDEGRKPMSSLGNMTPRGYWERVIELNGQLITLDTEYLFANQWNSTECGRVFNWHREITFSDAVERLYMAHYLEITDEMREIRHRTYKCGYCGAQYWDEQPKPYCTKCLGSEYLKESDLHLLELVRIEDEGKARHALADHELAEVRELWAREQISAKGERENARQKKERERIARAYDEAILKAEQTRAIDLWLLNNGFDNNNVIFYDHTQTLCWGWRNKLTTAERDELVARLGDRCPWKVEFKMKG